MPKVSVIVPVYNVEKYLRKCLDSLVNQTLEDIEIVMINDGATDSSPDICQEYVNNYPEKFVYASQENSGQAVARNRAFEMCSGDYIGFLDSDDYVLLDMFEKMYKKAIETDADYVACGYTDMLCTDDGIKKELIHYVASKVAKDKNDLFFDALASPFLHLYKREVIIDGNVRFPEGVIYEDTAFYLNAIPLIDKVAVIEEPLAVRIRHSNSTTSTISKERVEQIFAVMNASLDFYRKYGFWEEYEEQLTYFTVRVLLCSSMNRIALVEGQKNRIDLLNKTLEYIKNNFPNYRENKYMKSGLRNFYMKRINTFTGILGLTVIRLKSLGKRHF